MKVNGTRRFYARTVSLLLVAAVTLLCFGACPVWAAGEPKSITPVLYTADSTDIISSWEGSAGESSETEWTNWGIITESYDKNLQAEHISMPTSTDDRNIIVNFNPGLTKGENAYANLVIGARASADTDFHVNYMKSGGNFLEDGIDFTVSGGDTFKEYTVINPSGWNNWVWLPQMDTLRLLVSGGKCTEARTVDIAYIRVVKQT